MLSTGTGTRGLISLSMRGIRKSYPGVVALDGVDLDLRVGEVHVLLGENGAGKSTLMKVLSGSVVRDAGEIEIDGMPVALDSPRSARDAGIAIIHQELALVPQLSVAENLFLGRAPSRAGILDTARMHAESVTWLSRVGANIDPAQEVGTLSIAQQQLVEIARALSLDARILIMDEPTSALTVHETQRLFAVISGLTARGTSIIYISHRLDEIFAIGDRITVLRDGRHVATQEVRTADRNELIRQMANRDVAAVAARSVIAPGTSRLTVSGLTRRGTLHDVSFSVRRGEIVGVAGLLGAGRTELARALFGLDPLATGTVTIDGQSVAIRSPRDAIAAGIGFLTEDRQREGLVLDLSLRQNVVLPILSRLARLGVVRRYAETTSAETAVRELRIRATSIQTPVRALSGGNQQKVVLARWLATGARILLLDEPTRGVDVGAKQEIYQLMHELTATGVAIVLLSSDLPELLQLSDRVLVMRSGRIAAEFSRADATAERVMAAAVGG